MKISGLPVGSSDTLESQKVEKYFLFGSKTRTINVFTRGGRRMTFRMMIDCRATIDSWCECQICERSQMEEE